MNVTKQLYQWDTGQKLTECTGIYVDYLISDEVYRVEIIDGTCIIPDELLQTSGRYKVWECMADNTLREFAFKVLPRPIPPNYVFTPTEQLTFEGLVQKETNKFNTNAIEKLNAYNANADNRVAEFNAQTGQIQADVSELKSDMKLIDIECFDEGPIELGITTYLHSGTLVCLSGEPFSTISSTANAGFKYYDVPINGVKKIKATVFSQANTKGVIFTDADNTLIDYYPKNAIASPGEDLDIVCAVPSTATRVLLIGKTATAIKLYNNVQAYKMDADLSAAIATATDLSIEADYS